MAAHDGATSDDGAKERKRQHHHGASSIQSKIPRLFKPSAPGSAKKAKAASRIPRMASGIPRRRLLEAVSCDSSSDGTVSECPTISSMTESQIDDDPISFVATLREMDIARCLQEDLVRDNAKLKQQAEFIHSEIGYLYELLTQIEAAVQTSARSRRTHQRILDIIAAPMPTSLDPPDVPDDATF
ncbi:hypothetical protein SPRG_01224 [Saprolegnia parasitica CBS 223.65]|uniref:Uncharacterized protein n=1 Tax=Saprolegnia parasitica (strain CBS 223.65) TaxID=695850 RepID=A0A067D5E1_SAPPC|nr:hypothetical protein SPRG_01224 [Saprolegnia parasitica CBS 223.65]KDO33946.1 hypothetical protein SPRG_01224 [Saprolegnia parasitica CBS 223.65]|eukprot:XP_012194839.1 hypothetical protein SPRG_01224 [Saprolegnia parasitica CBS 223.65]